MYEFAPIAGMDSYIFSTESGWIYSVSFKESANYFIGNDIVFNSALVFEISFSRSQNRPIPQKGIDPLIKSTIQTIILHHFESKGHLPVYFFICYSADEKEAARLKLFVRWYESINLSEWQLYSYEIYDSIETIYCGLFVNINHPYYSNIPVEFESFVMEEKSVWKELFRRR